MAQKEGLLEEEEEQSRLDLETDVLHRSIGEDDEDDYNDNKNNDDDEEEEKERRVRRMRRYLKYDL